MKQRFPEVIAASEELAKTARATGPIDRKKAHLIQMATAAAIRSHRAIRSHERRALEAGAASARAGRQDLIPPARDPW